MPTAVDKARAAAAGHEAVCVSHQLPVWTLRRCADRQAALARPASAAVRGSASVTSLVYDGDRLVDVVYSEPAGTRIRR